MKYKTLVRSWACSQPLHTACAVAALLISLAPPLQAQLLPGAGARPAPVPDLLPPPPAGRSESLPDLLARVLASDPQVRTAQALLQATENRRLQARSRLGPSATLTASSRHGTDFDALAGLTDRRSDRAEAGLRWNLYNAGNDAAEIDGATRDVAAALQDLRRAREDTTERLSESYVELLRVQELLPHSEARLTAVRQLAAQIKRQNDAGKASDADYTQAEASLLDAQIVHEQLLADQEAAREKLAAQVGTEVVSVLPVAFRLRAEDVLRGNTPGLVEAAQLRAQAARARVRPVSSLFAPRIDLEYRRQLSDHTQPLLSTIERETWMVTARWEFPVLGETMARRTEVMRRAEAAEAEAERVARGTNAELQAVAARIAGSERAVAQLDKQLQQYDALVRAGELQFEAGRRSVAQLITLRDSRYNAVQRRVEQSNRLLVARMRQLALAGMLLPALGLGNGAETVAP